MKKNKMVFIVDDDVFYSEILKQELSKLKDVEIETFVSAEDCLLNLNRKPNLIILDFYLDSDNPANMTGHEAIGKIFSSQKDVKVLFVSGTHNETLLEEYKKYRAVDFVLKAQDGEGKNTIRQKVLACLQAA
jgi:FixJ family two-component response regulator